MRPRSLAIDVGAVVLSTAVVLIVSPGWAVTGLIALLVLVGCALSLAWDARRSR